MTPAARKELRRLDVKVQTRILRRLVSLEERPRPFGSEKLAGEDPQYRLRVGDYRVIYEIYDRELVVLVIRVAHRSIAYRR
jgi:mRNA interferase RelE/StbE